MRGVTGGTKGRLTFRDSAPDNLQSTIEEKAAPCFSLTFTSTDRSAPACPGARPA